MVSIGVPGFMTALGDMCVGLLIIFTHGLGCVNQPPKRKLIATLQRFRRSRINSNKSSTAHLV